MGRYKVNQTTGELKDLIAGAEDANYLEVTQAQWDALSASEKAQWTGKYVIITDDEGVSVLGTVSGDGTKTFTQLFNDIYAILPKDIKRLINIHIYDENNNCYIFSRSQTNFATITFTNVENYQNDLNVSTITLSSETSTFKRHTISPSGVTVTDFSSNAASATRVYTIVEG